MLNLKLILTKPFLLLQANPVQQSNRTAFTNIFIIFTKKDKIENPGKHFIAITDNKTSLEEEAKNKNFRYVFTNPEDYGGRYSALSFFGLVPMALIGINIKEILNSAYRMKQSCSPFIPSDLNPGVNLGVFLGINQKLGKRQSDIHSFSINKIIWSLG